MINDDWMHPKTSHAWTAPKPHADGTFFLISRKKRIPVFGNVPFLGQWETWMEFTNKADRDAELKTLRETTDWTLRADQVIYMRGEVLPGSNRRDIIDV